jgi:hypothetical protein
MANENLGSISCKFHDEPKTAHVRRDRKGKLYIYCDDCGITSPRAEKFQRYIEKEAVMFGETAPTPEPEPVPAPVPAKNKTMEEELGL